MQCPLALILPLAVQARLGDDLISLSIELKPMFTELCHDLRVVETWIFSNVLQQQGKEALLDHLAEWSMEAEIRKVEVIWNSTILLLILGFECFEALPQGVQINVYGKMAVDDWVL